MLLEEQRQSTLKRIHFIAGVAGAVIFLGTAMYMRLRYNGLEGMDALPRMLFRSSHIYLLLTSLLNLSLGLYLSSSIRMSRLALTGSILILLSPLLMLLGFFYEPLRGSFERPLVGPGVYVVFAGMLLHLIASLRAGRAGN